MNRIVSKHIGDLAMPIKVADMTLYDIPELSKTLKVTPLTLRNYIKQGKLRGRKVGRRWLVTEESLRDYLNARPEKEGNK